LTPAAGRLVRSAERIEIERFVRERGVWKFQERLGTIQMKFAGDRTA
jgi:hypothetical protein